MPKQARPQGLIWAVLLLVIFLASPGQANYQPLSRAEFDQWPNYPEYTIFNFFPSKGGNCTWYAHGRMMQLGYSKYTLDSMRFNANSWAANASRGAILTDMAQPGAIAFWDSYQFYGSALGHVAVVEAVREDGSILLSDSSSSASAYRTFVVYPEESRWPTAFIVVPQGPEPSQLFSAGEIVQTTAGGLNFRLAGVNQGSLLLERDTLLTVTAHPSNGLYASPPGSTTAYYHWWYVSLAIDGALSYGWVAESFLQSTGLINPDSGLAPVPVAEPDPVDPTPPAAADPMQPEEPAGSVVIKHGDLLGNGMVDVRDVTLVMQHVLQIVTLDSGQLLAADVNTDGQVDVRDATLIMQHVLGLLPAF